MADVSQTSQGSLGASQTRPDPSRGYAPVGVWSNNSQSKHRRGLMSLWTDYVEWRTDRRQQRHEKLVRLALVGEGPPKIAGALGLWGAFLTVEGVMAFLTGFTMWILYAPAFRWADSGWEVAQRFSAAGLVVMLLSLLYMVAIAFGLLAIRALSRKRALHLRRVADEAIGRAADARVGYVFSEPVDEAEAELLHEHDRLALAGKPLVRQAFPEN